MSYDQIPKDELDIFKSLDVKVVFDVGSRDDSDYAEIKPDIELHCFEPNPLFFNRLKEKLGNRPNTYLNNFGLGDTVKEQFYNNFRQGFIDGDSPWEPDGDMYPISTLDTYTEEHEITSIDFLKIDTEGYDYKVLMGGQNTLKFTKYVQYEYWTEPWKFHGIFEQQWFMTYIGGRNVLCTKR